MSSTVFAAPPAHRTRPAFQGTRRSVSTILRARRCRDPSPRLFGQTLDFGDREHLARFLRELGNDRFRPARNKRFNFVSVEPDEMTALADIDADFPLVR